MASDKLKHPDIVDLLVPLRRYARSLTRDALRADDLVHDTLVRALEMQGSLRPNTNLRTWMMTVLHNAFIDEQRRRQVEARHADALVRMSEDMAPPAQEGRVRLAQIRQAFLTLPEEQRAALHLVTLEGMAYADAAAVLGIPIGTLMSRLGRGRAALRAFEDGARGTTEAEPETNRPDVRRGTFPGLRLVASDQTRDRPPIKRAAGDA
ncbi:sigma-70 family RNA polymerase sigma factor [Methylobacterium sp. WL18]|jgi:RNA polymerase sigma-70 factor (ECF subfamily)|uniref:sigma-70 family RNA polymerase sigma factor n=1 Tax=unclassified Methylobacterium TaxID=2615210 RepID=UPI0011C9A3CD|nr:MULTISPECIES: sigma-70 family RNA polymerase sigma factor [unclassified Methylobacterium]TXN43303.1 sigma-70 family RNA polymerase sigma factor [Methylobacterium sp. WL7]TXN50238.1 sigma-70 family RNA polymerase sigma factor [Methylobacterium sp. WL18]